MMRAESIGEISNPEALGTIIANELRAQGADVILAELAL
jgi:basic membrane lipoprotein Med (substrate-binding protein (PBP1-ABC) superfamily)